MAVQTGAMLESKLGMAMLESKPGVIHSAEQQQQQQPSLVVSEKVRTARLLGCVEWCQSLSFSVRWEDADFE